MVVVTVASVRVTGTVLEARLQRGEDYSNTIVRVMVGKSDVTEVKFGDRYEDLTPREGDVVDLLVAAIPYAGRSGAGVSFRAVRPWAEADTPVGLVSVGA